MPNAPVIKWVHVENRILPTFLAANVAAIVIFSQYGIKYPFVDNEARADAVAGVYVAILAWFAITQRQTAWMHILGSALAVMTYGGQIFRYTDLYSQNKWAVLSPITSSMIVLLAALTWHRRMMMLGVKMRVRAEINDDS